MLIIMPMKQSNTFDLSEKTDDYANKKHEDYCPGKQTINNILNYARSLEVFDAGNNMVFFSISN